MTTPIATSMAVVNQQNGTLQKNLERKILANSDLEDFIKRQLDLSLCLLKYLNPKVIIVVNARASKVLLENLTGDLALEWCATGGYHTISLNGRITPVFLAFT